MYPIRGKRIFERDDGPLQAVALKQIHVVILVTHNLPRGRTHKQLLAHTHTPVHIDVISRAGDKGNDVLVVQWGCSPRLV